MVEKLEKVKGGRFDAYLKKFKRTPIEETYEDMKERKDVLRYHP